jgi:hypothetical protein
MQGNNEFNYGKIRLRLSDHAFCPVCQKLIRLVTFTDAALIFKTDEEDITSQAESLKLHRVHNRRGNVMICTDSLFSYFDERETRPLRPDFLSASIAKEGRIKDGG